MNNGQILILSTDYTTLPEGLLDSAKAQMRVTFDRDDEYITQALKRAINLYEQFIGRTLFAREVQWSPLPYPTVQAPPFQPVSSLSALDADGNDVSGDYQRFTRSGSEWVGTADATTAFGDDVTLTLTTGIDDADNMPPGALDIVLRITAGLYENREHQTPVTMTMVGFWIQDLIVGGNWIPRA